MNCRQESRQTIKGFHSFLQTPDVTLFVEFLSGLFAVILICSLPFIHPTLTIAARSRPLPSRAFALDGFPAICP